MLAVYCKRYGLRSFKVECGCCFWIIRINLLSLSSRKNHFILTQHEASPYVPDIAPDNNAIVCA